MADNADIKSGKVKEPDAGDIGHMYVLRTLVHPNEIKRLDTEKSLFKEEMEANGCIFVNEMVKDTRPQPKEKHRAIGKGMFMQLLSPKEDGELLSKEGEKILLGYMFYLETVLGILKLPEFQIPDEMVDKIVEDVAFRVNKIATINEINYYTNKNRRTLKKGDLQAMISPRSRWRSCISYYSDDKFTAEELDKFSEYLGIVLK